MVKTANEIFRDWNTDGVPASGVHKPIKADIRDLLAPLEEFPTVASMVSSTKLSIGQKRTTLGYFTPGDGGGNTYEIVAAGTGTADGGSYINLTGSGLQAKGIFDNPEICCEKWGAVDGVESSAAINAANAYLLSRSFLLSDSYASRSRLILKMSSAVLIKDKVTIGNTSGYNMDVDFRGSLISCISGGNLTATEPALTVQGTSSIRFLCRIHCNKLCSGYLILTSGNSKTYGTYARWVASASGAYGIKVSGSGDASRGHTLYDPVATEWEANNVEADTSSAYLATGVIIDDWDGMVYGGHPGFCGVAIEFGVNSGNYFWDHPHPFCNNARNQATYPRQDPIAILCNNTNRCYINAPYIDSGYIVDNGGCVVIEGPGMQFNSSEAAPGLSQPYIRVKETPTGGSNRTIISGVSNTIGYFVTDYKTVSSTGATFASSVPGYAVDGRYPEFFRQHQIYYNNADDTLPSVLESQKSGVNILKRHVFVGNVILDEIKRLNGSQVEQEIRANRLQVNANSIGDATSGLLLGTGGNGLRYDPSTGSLHSVVGSTIRWNINGTSYAWVPGATNTYNVGASNLTVKDGYFQNAIIVVSDERTKQNIENISDIVLDAWELVEFQQYRLKSSVESKGDAARLHTGLIAQRIHSVFVSVGLDPFAYGLLCYDEWDGGNSFSLRYEEALCVEAAYQRRRADRIETRLAALEAKLSA
jgi:hypothetical protein